MTNRVLLTWMSVASAASGCGSATPAASGLDGGEDEPPHRASNVGSEIAAKLIDQSFQPYAGPFKDRTPAPAISSYRQDPVNALGSIYAKVAKPSKTCSSTDVSDFEYRRLIEERPDGCEPQVFPAITVARRFVDGKAAAEIDYIVGKAALGADFAYEFIVSEPVTATFRSTGKCIVETKIDALRIPHQTCDLRYVAGVVVTQVSYRQFKRLQSDVSASYFVKVGGSVYGSSEEIVNKWYLTVDTLDLTRFFVPDDATGFLGRPTQEKVAISGHPVVDERERAFLLESLSRANAYDFVANVNRHDSRSEEFEAEAEVEAETD